MNYEYEVLTVRDLDFVDDRGRPIKGMQLWVCGESAEQGWNGWEVVKIWIPDGNLLETTVSQLRHNDQILVTYDRRGKPLKIEVI